MEQARKQQWRVARTAVHDWVNNFKRAGAWFIVDEDGRRVGVSIAANYEEGPDSPRVEIWFTTEWREA